MVVAPAEQRDVPIYLDGLGTVQAFYTVTIHTMVDGPLVAVDFKEGQDVHKGDVLAQVDPRTYQAALDQATAKKAQDEAQLANARVDLARYQKLVATNYTTAQQADTQKALVAQLEAQVRQDQAQIDTARTQLSYCTIVSPIDGRTGIRQVDPGNIVHAVDTTGLVVITQLQPISVLFTLAAAVAAGGGATRMQRGGSATVLAYAQGAGGEPRAGAGYRRAVGAGQPGRSHHGHDQAEGDVPQPGPPAVAGRVRWRAAAGGHRARRDRGAAGGDPARPERPLCVRRRRERRSGRR